MRLLGLLMSVLVLAGVMVYAYRYYFTVGTNVSGLDTTLPAVEQQVEKMQEKVELYDQKMKNDEEIIDQKGQK